MKTYDLGKVVGPPGPSGLKEVNVSYDSNGYIIYEGGVLECWGFFSIPQGDTWYEIKLPKNFINANYNIQVSSYYGDSYNPVYVGKTFLNKFSLSAFGEVTGTVGVYWKCIGKTSGGTL